MPQWKWTIYESNELDKLLYEYLKSCKRMKESIVQAIEAFYLPYALKHMGASPLEVQKAYQRSIDILRSRVRIMSLDAGRGVDANVTTSVEGQLQPSIERQQGNRANTERFDDRDELDEDVFDDEPPLFVTIERIMKLED
jgi:hypothetical protein